MKIKNLPFGGGFDFVEVDGNIDTDGSVVIHKYIVNGKQYTYKKINFSSALIPLLKSVFNI